MQSGVFHEGEKYPHAGFTHFQVGHINSPH